VSREREELERPGDSPAAPEPSAHEESPPLLGTWPRLYGAVLLNLAALIALFTWFTRAFQ
jgi:hypothetical protein